MLEIEKYIYTSTYLQKIILILKFSSKNIHFLSVFN